MLLSESLRISGKMYDFKVLYTVTNKIKVGKFNRENLLSYSFSKINPLHNFFWISYCAKMYEYYMFCKEISGQFLFFRRVIGKDVLVNIF